MSQTDKSRYYRALKAAGVQFQEHYREYSEEDLKAAYDALPDEMKNEPAKEEPKQEALFDMPKPEVDEAALKEAMNRHPAGKAMDDPFPDVPRSDEPIHKIAGLSDPSTGEIIRISSDGRLWLQEEIPKSATAKPRARLNKRYIDPGVKQLEFEGTDGYTETVEVAGDERQEREVKVTLPTYQVGVCIDPRFKNFKIITYRGNEGFDYFDVVNFYGAEDLVPEGIKKMYVESVLCFDIRTTIREIQAEARRLQLGIPQEG
mgnify:CR=1 FL=1|nr:MAG TPA_asm: hypothetical protein [Caudoviricetes sp.]